MNAPPSKHGSTPDESSVLFSLSELLDLESERVEEEERERQHAIERARREREELLLRQREQEQARALALEEERRRLELRRREEEARLVAISEAEIEKARHQAENEARLRLVAQAHEHEERLALIREDRAKQRLRRLVVGSLIAAASALALGFAWVDSAKKDAARKLAQLELQAEEQKKQVDEKIRRLLHEKEQVSAADLQKRKALEEELGDLRKKRAEIPGGGPKPTPVVQPGSRNDAPPTPPPPGPRCEDGDPMCPL